ncbi:MAG: hypothetical protein RBU37_24840 [Myxococcota bacterium]|jgi:hypothetical protein|nr:hypothetical protein [Myxococcota bacterium]
MQKFFALFMILSVSLAFACSGGEKKDDTIKQSAEAAEAWTSVEVYEISENMEAEENKKLHCKLWKAQSAEDGAKFGYAEGWAESQCNWAHISARVELTKPVPEDKSVGIVDVIAGIDFPASEKMQKRDCASIFLTTNKREIVTFDCTIGNREGAAAEKGWKPAYEPGASTSPEEAAFRLYGLFGFMR